MTSLARCRRPDRPLHHVITAKRDSVTRFATWAQGSLATVTCGGCESSRLRTWAGLSKSQRFRGLLLSSAATSAKYSAECTDRSVPWGKYWRSSPLMLLVGSAPPPRRVPRPPRRGRRRCRTSTVSSPSARPPSPPGVTSDMAIALGRSTLRRFDVDWAGAGFSDELHPCTASDHN
jgi:hypothetical protein